MQKRYKWKLNVTWLADYYQWL